MGQPPLRGINWFAYILPPVALVVGIFLVYRTLRGMRPRAKRGLASPGPGSPEADQAAAPKDPYLARVEDELQKRR